MEKLKVGDKIKVSHSITGRTLGYCKIERVTKTLAFANFKMSQFKFEIEITNMFGIPRVFRKNSSFSEWSFEYIPDKK